jgi:hypothetical protein
VTILFVVDHMHGFGSRCDPARAGGGHGRSCRDRNGPAYHGQKR